MITKGYNFKGQSYFGQILSVSNQFHNYLTIINQEYAPHFRPLIKRWFICVGGTRERVP